jgi:hypothetical protein
MMYQAEQKPLNILGKGVTFQIVDICQNGKHLRMRNHGNSSTKNLAAGDAKKKRCSYTKNVKSAISIS